MSTYTHYRQSSQLRSHWTKSTVYSSFSLTRTPPNETSCINKSSTQLEPERGIQGLATYTRHNTQFNSCRHSTQFNSRRYNPNPSPATEALQTQQRGALQAKVEPKRIALQEQVKRSAGERRQHAAAALRRHHDLPARAFQWDKRRPVRITRWAA